jgi:ketosteroid isomerase-like protein
MLKMLIIAAILLPLTGIAQTEEDMSKKADSVSADEAAILGILDTYAKAFQDADADLAQSLVWLEDERFSEIEDMIAYPFGKQTYLDIMDWIRNNAKPGTKEMKFHQPTVFSLAENVAYVIALQEIKSEEGQSISRVTLIFLKKDGEWKIIHGHFSPIPRQEE